MNRIYVMLLFSLLIPVFLVGHSLGYNDAIRDVDRFNGQCSVQIIGQSISPVNVHEAGSLIWGCVYMKLEDVRNK